MSNYIVNTKFGKVKGFTEDKVVKYYGISYAANPTGDLRWKPPVDPEPWSDVFNANKFGPISYQVGFSGDVNIPGLVEDENCLNLNIWKPDITDSNLPVMVWIHGGGFSSGAGSVKLYDGSELTKKGVIVVSINYRLGPFGFLSHSSLDDEQNSLSGNYGILDQIKALNWIKNNIKYFGGDSNNITLFGESSGASSIEILYRCNEAKKLFHKIILQSNPGFIVKNSKVIKKRSNILLNELNVSNMNELRKVQAEDIINATKKIKKMLKIPILFTPVYDNDYIIKNQNIDYFNTKISVMAGINKDEYTYMMKNMPVSMNPSMYKKKVRETFAEKAEIILKKFSAGNNEEAYKSATKVFSSYKYGLYLKNFADILADNNCKIYVYRFSRIAPKNIKNRKWASHVEEIPYIFGHVYSGGYNEKDYKLSELMMNYWTNFAKNGDPNRKNLKEWPAYKQNNDLYLNFDIPLRKNHYSDKYNDIDLLIYLIENN